MTTRRPGLALGIGVALAVGGAAVVWLASRPSAPGRSEPPEHVTPPTSDGTAEAPSPDRRQLAATLAVRVVCAGDPAPGSIAVVEGKHAPDALTRSHPITAASTHRHDGAIEVPVTPGSWCWVRAESAGTFGLALVPPWEGRMAITIALDTPSLHLLVLAADLSTPVSGCEVRIGRRPQTPAAALEIQQRVTTDRHGYSRVDQLESGTFVLLAPGATPTSGSPAVQVAAVHPGTHDQQLVVLVAPGPRRKLRLDVHATFEPDIGRQPILFLERMDDGSGELFPLPGIVRPGAHQVELEVPDGSYRLGVVPLGSLVIATPGERIVVDGPTDHVVQIADNAQWTEVHLRGVGYDSLPLRVGAWRVGATSPPDPDLVYLGPQHWGQPRVSVQSLPEARRLVASGRGHAFISREPVVITGPSVEAEMIPASLVTIRWENWGTLPGGCMCATATSVGEFARPFRRRLAIDPGTLRPVWMAEFAVPREPVTFECTGEDGGVLWQRELRPARWRETILVDP